MLSGPGGDHVAARDARCRRAMASALGAAHELSAGASRTAEETPSASRPRPSRPPSRRDRRAPPRGARADLLRAEPSSPARRKCTPVDHRVDRGDASDPPARTTAASSPGPAASALRPAQRRAISRSVSAAMFGSGLSPPPMRAAVPVDDPRAIEVVGRELAADAIAGKDANPKAPHLPRDVPEHDVLVVERTRNIALGSASITSPSNSTLSSFATSARPIWPVARCARTVPSLGIS